MIASSLCLIGWHFLIEPFSATYVIVSLINVLLAIILGLLTFYFRIWGGGDSKALMALGFSTPYTFSFIRGIPQNLELMPPILFLLFNLLFGLLCTLLWIILKNLINYRKFGGWFHDSSFSKLDKLRILSSAAQIPVKEILEKKHYDPAEVYDGEKWNAYIPTFIPDMEDEEMEAMELKARELGFKTATESRRTFLWSRFQVPGLLSFLIGYLIWILLGSPMATFLSIIA